MRLDYLFDIEVRFKEEFLSAETERSPAGPAVGHLCYSVGDGTVSGERLRGTLRWTNRARKRDDGIVRSDPATGESYTTHTWLPHVDGVILTDEGAKVLFSFAGYNQSLEVRDGWHHRAITGRIIFSSMNHRYRWLNNVFGVMIGRGGWPMGPSDYDEEGYARDMKEVWKLPTYACVNELATSTPSGKERTALLESLFTGELSFHTAAERFPTAGKDGDWLSYGSGDGRIDGEKLGGELICTNMSRRRADGVWLSHLRGKIRTTNGELILFAFRGYNISSENPFEYKHREITGSLTFRTAAEPYGWLNGTIGLLEGEAAAEDIEDWQLRAFTVINDLARSRELTR